VVEAALEPALFCEPLGFGGVLVLDRADEDSGAGQVEVGQDLPFVLCHLPLPLPGRGRRREHLASARSRVIPEWRHRSFELGGT
jgi:hypothetical protein